jgi:hypothetical protein
MKGKSSSFAGSLGVESSPSMYDVVLPTAKEVESVLRRLGYSGRGIHELVTCAGDDLTPDVRRATRKIATLRNKVVHEANFEMSDNEVNGFRSTALFVVCELDAMAARRLGVMRAGGAGQSGGKKVEIALTVLVVLGVLARIFLH